MSNRQTLKIGVPSLPSVDDLDFGRVRTLAVHETLQYLGGAPLFSYDKHLEAIYASSADPNEDFTQWVVRFDPKARFSDGTPLTAAHWYHSIARNIRFGAGVHFNPKIELVGGTQSQDGYCEGLELSGNEVRLKLVKPNRSLRRLIGKIEATVLPITSAESSFFDLMGAPSSGPFKLVDRTADEFLLERNPFYPHRNSRSIFDAIQIKAAGDEELFERRRAKELDFIFPAGVPPVRTQALLGQAYPYHGETIFLSFRNCNSDWSSNPILRATLSARLAERPALDGLDKTSVIFQKKGLGRLSSAPTLEDSGIPLPVLSIAAVESQRARKVLGAIGSLVPLEVIWVANFNELFKSPANETHAFLG